MYAVGRLGSYITRGVSTVSGPFHPFGGAVDIVVVRQQDGSLKSSPWYVRFGKFQGVLKAKERIVDINVNGADADFHMYLNPRGEAYFLKEKAVSEELDTASLPGKESVRNERCLRPLKSKSLDCNFDQCDSLIDVGHSRAFSRNLGFVIDRKTESDDSLSDEEDKTNHKNHEESNKNAGEITRVKSEASLVLHEEHFVNHSDDKERNSKLVKGHKGSSENGGPEEERLSSRPETAEEPLKLKSSLDSNGGFQGGSKDSHMINEEPDGLVEQQQFTFSDLDDLQETKSEGNQESFEGDTKGMKGNIRRFSSDNDIAKCCELEEHEAGAQAKSLPNMYQNNLDDSSYFSFDPERRPSKWEILRNDTSRIIKEGEEHPSGSQCADTISKELKNGNNEGGGASNIVDDSGKSWSLWPFRKSRSKKVSQKEQECKKECDIDGGSKVDVEKEGPLSKSRNMQRALAPTPEQLESLNLSEGKNTVTFTFSTPVLGNQQVDARIFLWRWDTRIVISDVDGTITKSDVLGQFMPLVGKDWSHIGVTHLFSAIKENGYQILFLSARSISQADVTRQFLFNLKQNGKALPEGPVVISPDGLFPSLFREVIRRAPHEFKIACLEDIKACFPATWNPFYAGFGNRDTDEFSYLKVGIPKGKIFIINPKGEVVVNRCIDSKSYTSLHAIVNGIFPPVSEEV